MPTSDIQSSQFTSKPSTEGNEEATNSAAGPTPAANQGTKATESGIEKSPQTGSAVTADAKTTTNDPKTLESAGKVGGNTAPSTTANRPNTGAVKSPTNPTLNQAAKTSATAPSKPSVNEISTESDNTSGVMVEMKRTDGITLQFPMTFREKQDLYSTKNMFDLMGKMIALPAEELEKEYPAFIKG